MRLGARAMLVGGIALGLLLSFGGEATAGTAPSSPQPAAEVVQNYMIGIELRASGIGPCSPSTPAPCSLYVYSWACPADGFFRLTRIRTYMAARTDRFVGFRLKARLVESGQPPSGPWSEPDVETFPPRNQETRRLMQTSNISGLSSLSTDWDIQTRFTFDRRGLPDIIINNRAGPVSFEC